MKTNLFIIFLVVGFISFKAEAQSTDKTITDSTYAVIQITSLSQKVFGEYEINIFYGNGKIEGYKKLVYNGKNEKDLINELANALNYMSRQGYTLKQSLTFSLPTPKFQYIFERVAGAK